MPKDGQRYYTPCIDCGKPCARQSPRCTPCASAFRKQNRPDRFCGCGCGQPLPRQEYAKDYIKKYLPEHRPRFTGPANSRWKGGRYIDSHGYVRIYAPEHHEADKNGHALEHRLVYEQFHNVVLSRTDIIHHLNRVKDDNRPENLQCVTGSAHTGIHTFRFTLDDLLRFIPEVFAAYGEWPDSPVMTKDKRFPVYRVWRKVLGCKSWAEVRQKATEIHNANYQ